MGANFPLGSDGAEYWWILLCSTRGRIGGRWGVPQDTELRGIDLLGAMWLGEEGTADKASVGVL